MLAAGMSWTLVIASAGWGVRAYHTSVIDAAGAIYVIGGWNGGDTGGTDTYYKDVWVSTDGGARAGLRQGMVGGYYRG